MALLKGGTVVNGTITGTLIGNADTATALKQNVIAASTDLNTITNSGLYTATAEVAATLTNSPVTDADFALKVDKISDTVSMQNLYATNARVYSRPSATGTWFRMTGE